MKITIDALTSEGYRMMIPDQMGFGKSSESMGYAVVELNEMELKLGKV